MPQIKIERIVSFSSEDPTHTASNVISKDPSKKWKCKTPGEKCASVILQLDKPYVINCIDIGNENSAYIEVFVARSIAPEEFKLLLVMSSFMTPFEARQTQNVNKVRMFKQEDLSDPERNEKWDRVKIVCTQPFNKHVQYGLSFINLYAGDGKNTDASQQVRIGKFIIRPESPDNFTAGSLFAKRKQSQDSSQEQTLKGAAAIREATSLAHGGSPLPKQKLKLNLGSTPSSQSNKNNNTSEDESTSKERKERNRNELLYNKDEEDRHDKIDKLIERRAEEKAKTSKEDKTKQAGKQKDTPSKLSGKKKEHRDEKRPLATTTSDSKPKRNNSPRTSSTSKDSNKRKLSDDSGRNKKKPKKGIVEKPFARLLEDVVLVISGIQNPDRASLRSMALSMGARYKRDWDNTCTHLICAFANTPKFHQVKGKGKIVKRKWLEDCYSERKKIPWRKYALDKADQGPESEEEICEKDNTPSPEAMESYGIDSDSDDDTKEHASDTDEKIAKIRRKQIDQKTSDTFSVDTDEEHTDCSSHANLKIKDKLKNFFEDKIFYVDENFDEHVQKKIKQYIAAYNGIVRDNLEVCIDIIVTNEDNYKVLKDIYPTTVCVAPDWIWECHNCQRLMPMKDYIYE